MGCGCCLCFVLLRWLFSRGSIGTDYLLNMNNEPISVGDLVLWTPTDPPVLGIVVGFFNHGYAGIDVLWFGDLGQNVVSPARRQDIKVISSVKKS